MFSALRPLFFRFNCVVFVVRAFRSLFIAYLYLSVRFFGVVGSVACACAIAARFVDVDEACAFSNDSRFNVSFDDFVDDVRGTIDERGRVDFL